MNYDKFTELRLKRNVPLLEIADCVGLSRQWLVKCVKNDTLNVSQIKKICALLRCKSDFFFE